MSKRTEEAVQAEALDDVETADQDHADPDQLDEDYEDGEDGEFEPPLNPVMMTLSSIGLFIGFLAFVFVCIPMWWNGSGH